MLYSALVWPTLQVSYKKDAKASLHYTTVADRPDIKKATQAAKLISEVSRHITVMNHQTKAEMCGTYLWLASSTQSTTIHYL